MRKEVMSLEEDYRNLKQAGAKTNGDGEKNISSSRFSSLLASKDRDFLLSPDGTQVQVSELEGKVVGLYFSANWYPPCRNFTEILINAYEHLNRSGSKFEVVFVSSDEDLDAFNKYRALMPWLSIPFSDLETKKALDRKFDIESIPCLIILQPKDTKDEATLHDGVEIIYRFGIQAFPFTKQRLQELERQVREKHESQTLTNLLTNLDREYLLGHPPSKQVPVDSLLGKTIGLFFSAQWCRPGVKFTPKLVSIYHKIKQLLTQQASEDFEGIPCLIILGPDGKTITKHGRNLINLYQEDAYPFTEAKVDLLEKQIDEEAKSLPKSEYHVGHKHELTLVSQETGGGPFICCDCDEQGSGWAYLCLDCGYEVHPKCVRAMDRG